MPLSQTEYVARALFRHYLPRERVVYGVRPDWLMNPETGNCLELDLYWPDVNMAAEIDGSQHFRFTPGLQKTYGDYEKQLRHDSMKIRVCLERGITFHRLDIFALQQNRFELLIKRLYQSWGRLPEFEHIQAPTALFASVERLSRARVVPKKPKPTRWFRRLFS